MDCSTSRGTGWAVKARADMREVMASSTACWRASGVVALDAVESFKAVEAVKSVSPVRF
jgi:hypothetical protein